MNKRKVYVKPVNSGGLFGWQALELTIWQSFLDDRRRYGWRVALHNLLVELGLRKIQD